MQVEIEATEYSLAASSGEVHLCCLVSYTVNFSIPAISLDPAQVCEKPTVSYKSAVTCT